MLILQNNVLIPPNNYNNNVQTHLFQNHIIYQNPKIIKTKSRTMEFIVNINN